MCEEGLVHRVVSLLKVSESAMGKWLWSFKFGGGGGVYSLLVWCLGLVVALFYMI